MIYLVTRIGFDNMENEIGSARERSILGYAESREEAERVVDNALREAAPYRGWDQQTYPQFEITPVEKVAP